MILPGLKCAGYPACVVWLYTAPSFVIVSATRWRAVVSFGPRSEKFNIVSNDHRRTQKCDFCVLVCKTNFTDLTQYKVLEIHFWSVKHATVTVRYAKTSSISIHSYQVMQAGQCKRSQWSDYHESKPFQNAFKHI